MNKNEKIIQKMIKYFLLIVISIMILIILLDFVDITKYYPFNKFTHNYDWLSIIGAILGGLIGSIGTYIGIYITIKNERDQNKQKEIDERKRTGYSYIHFTETPVSIRLSLDSVITGLTNLSQNQSILIGENVDVVGANFFDIELNFANINSNYPTAVKLDTLDILYDCENMGNQKEYKGSINLYGYNKDYKPLTIKNGNIVAFSSIALINKEQLQELNTDLRKSDFVDIRAIISFVNANGIITKGIFSANLVKANFIKLGYPHCLGSNKIKFDYKAENTYLNIENIEYIENYDNEVFGKKMEEKNNG